MTDATTITASKPAATSTTIQSATVQFIVSLTALLVVFFPKDADKINSTAGLITGYLPMIIAVAVAVIPFVGTILGRFKAQVPLH